MKRRLIAVLAMLSGLVVFCERRGTVTLSAVHKPTSATRIESVNVAKATNVPQSFRLSPDAGPARSFRAAGTLAAPRPGGTSSASRYGTASAAGRSSFSEPKPASQELRRTSSGSTVSQPNAPIAARVVESYGRLPLSFEPNQGQADAQVTFLSRGSGHALFLTSSEAVLALRKRLAPVERRKSARQTFRSPVFSPARKGIAVYPQNNFAFQNRKLQSTVLRMRMLGANSAAKVTGLDELPSKSNYFIGNNAEKWRRNVPNYAKVRYQNIYPGIDLVYYGNQRQLEYDFVVDAGADAERITLEVIAEGPSGSRGQRERGKGASLWIDRGGDLVVPTDGGEIRFRKPFVYQPVGGNPKSQTENRQYLDGRYVLKGKGKVGFEVATYDATKPLIIDPVLSYSTYLGGGNDDVGFAIAVDTSGNAYVTGRTLSTNFPVSATPKQGTCASCALVSPKSDVFVTKLNPSVSGAASLIYSTYLGGSGLDEGHGIAVDSSGNAYVTGITFSTDFPVTGTVAAFQTTNKGGGDAFVTKIKSDGSALLYSTFLGGTCLDEGLAVAVDGAGKAYVTGDTCSDAFPKTTNAFQGTRASTGSSPDVFISKVDPTVSGAGSLVYSTYLGGTGDDVGNGIAVNSAGAIYITGKTTSTDFPKTAGAFDGTCGSDGSCDGGASDAFVTKLDPSLTGTAQLVYSTYLGGGSADSGNAIAVDASGNAYVTGLTKSPDFPATVGVLQPSLKAAGFDAFVTKLNPAASGAASLVYSTYLGGSGFDEGRGIVVDPSGNAYVAGSTGSLDFPATSPTQATCAGCPGGTDAFIIKLNSAASAIIFSTYLGGAASDSANGIALDSSGNAYVTGSSQSTDFPPVNAFQANFGDGTCGTDAFGNPIPCADAFVAKVSNLALPVLSLSSKSLSFGDQAVGTTSAAKAVTLTNNGDATLNIASIVLTGDFAQTAGSTCGASVPAGGNCSVSVSFTPSTTGTRTGTVTITDNAFGSPHTISLTGNGVSLAVVSLSSSSLSFGNQLVGTASVTQTVTLSNTGTGVMNLNGISINVSSFAQTNTCGVLPAQITAGGTCTINVRFSPSSTGSFAATLTMNDDAPGNPHTVTLTGNGVAPAVTLLPTSLNFSDQVVGTTSPAQTVTLTNSGTATLNISNITASGDFAQTNTCGTLPAQINSGASCAIAVTFRPTTTGVRRGSVAITDDASGSPQSVSLTGNGVASSVTLSPLSLTFADQLVGTTSAAQTVTLTNNGTSALTISSIGASGDFAQTNKCPISPNTLAVGASCTITVTFTPTTTGTRRGGVNITDDAPGSPQSVSLTGTGIVTTVSVTPSSLAFADQLVGTTSPAQTVTLTDTGGAALTISSIAASGDFAQTNNCPVSPNTLAVGASCTITVTFRPTTTGTRRGGVTISDDAAGSPQSVSLTGNGVAPAVTILPASLSFPDQLVGTTSQPQTATLTNSGGAALTISSISASGDFAQTNNCPISPNTLAAGASCTTTVTFTPTTTGVRRGSVNITDDASGSPQSLSLSGNGVVPAVTLLPASLSFGSQIVGTTSAAQAVTLSNSGGAPLTISSIVAGSADFAQTNTCPVSPATLPAGANCTITVTFTPTTTDIRRGAITITDDASGSPQTVPLSGTGTDFLISASPTSATITAGQSATFTVTLRPAGGFNQAITLGCTGAPPAATCTVSPSSVTLDGFNPSSATATVTTTARSMVPPAARPRAIPPLGPLMRLLCLALLLALVLWARRLGDLYNHQRAWLRASAPFGILVLLVALWAACGGGGGAPPPPHATGTSAGTFTLTITASSGSLRRNTTLTLTVN